jgi:hydrogenase expression/formation protein HypC
MCVAIPGQIVEFCGPDRFLARVDVAGVRRAVNVALVSGGDDGVQVGDWVLVHAGSAISRLDEHEARATRELLDQLVREYGDEIEDPNMRAID